MPKQCPQCKSLYPNFVDFCVTDGLRLEGVVEGADQIHVRLSEVGLETGFSTGSQAQSTVAGRARLIPKVRGQASPVVIEFFGTVVLGRFDPSVGAVDIDLSEMPGHEFISPRHARLVFEDDRWFVEDLDSDNGVFIDRSTRVTVRTPLESGQELALGNALFLFEADLPKEESESGDTVATPA